MAGWIPFNGRAGSGGQGRTGWGQFHRPYWQTLTDNEEKLSYDLFYIKNMSIALDFLILFQTVKTLLLGRGSR